ncbi:MAG TPA: Uma2 family endonuclease [Longimicrobiaceae bacterium]|nr:Uma2 family endonuclease [Longimicrobiaceae bacterium]
MTTTYTPTPVSPEEYLVRERAAKYKSEYVAGEVRAMAGASRAHVLISANLVRELGSQLRGRPCETYGTDIRVRVSRTRDYVYPDVTVVCGEPQMEDEHFDTLLNPTLIVEVLSPSTAGYDRGQKWEMYRRIPSLQDYLLVSQGEPRVERYTRQAEGLWLFGETSGQDEVLHLDSIGCTLALRDVYERVL